MGYQNYKESEPMTTTKVLKFEIGSAKTTPNQLLNQLYGILKDKKVVDFTIDEIKAILKGKRSLKRDSEGDIEEAISEAYTSLPNETIHKWEIEKIEFSKEKSEIFCSFSSDYIDFYLFHGGRYPYLQSFFTSYRAVSHNGKALVFLFAPYSHVERAYAVLKAMFARIEVELITVVWEKNGIESILKSDAFRVTYGAFHKVDGDKNTGTVRGSELNASPTFQGFEAQGEVYSVSYLSTAYGNNLVGINGPKSLVRADMDETSTITYVKDYLLTYSDF